jgi:hypothetical protein
MSDGLLALMVILATCFVGIVINAIFKVIESLDVGTRRQREYEDYYNKNFRR